MGDPPTPLRCDTRKPPHPCRFSEIQLADRPRWGLAKGGAPINPIHMLIHVVAPSQPTGSACPKQSRYRENSLAALTLSSAYRNPFPATFAHYLFTDRGGKLLSLI
jgi:hypothetical protein